MARYLVAESVARLTSIGSEEFPKVIEDLGLNPEQAHRLKKLWELRIRGRCERCESQQGMDCVCPSTEKVCDNRRPLTVLGKLPHTTELMKVPCRKCGEQAPYTVRDALQRLSRKSDWSAFFRCSLCRKKGKENRKEEMALKEMKLLAIRAVEFAKETAQRADADKHAAERSAKKAEEAKGWVLRAEKRVVAATKELQAKNKTSEPVLPKVVHKQQPKKMAKKTKPLKPLSAPPKKRSTRPFKPLTHKPFANLLGEDESSQSKAVLSPQG